MTKKELENLFVTFKLKDLVEFFELFDIYWCQVNLKEQKVCISREGIDYEPIAFGEIIHKTNEGMKELWMWSGGEDHSYHLWSKGDQPSQLEQNYASGDTWERIGTINKEEIAILEKFGIILEDHTENPLPAQKIQEPRPVCGDCANYMPVDNNYGKCTDEDADWQDEDHGVWATRTCIFHDWKIHFEEKK
jgi:hypothetical protein